MQNIIYRNKLKVLKQNRSQKGHARKKKMPGNTVFEINTDQILNHAMKNRPVDSIGILSQTMQNTDTTAGFTNLLNLGLSGTLFKYNEEQMEEYTNAVGVMKNLQVIDILNSIIEGFNKQLTEANKSVYEGVDTNIRRNETFGAAPFNRRQNENIWDIRVCVASNLTGDKYKTRRFTDYNNYINSTVFFQPIKGLDGTTIDFTQASTYSNIDGEDLETYVGLESEWLNRKIEGVFGTEGTFSSHQQTEYTRLGDSFGRYYGDWMAGEALLGGAFYSKPMFPHGPNMLQTATMVAGVAGGPWAAFAVSMLTTSMQVADGSMSWKQGAFQVGMSASTACIGVGASELSGMVGGTASAVTKAGSRTMTQIAVENVSRTAANTLVSGISFDGEGFGYDKNRMLSGKTWLAAGVTAGAVTLAAGYNLSGFSSAAVSGIGSSLSAGITTGDWSKSFQTGAISAAGNYLGGLVAGGITRGLGTNNAYTESLISNYTTFGMRKLLGGDEKFNMGTISQVDTMNLVVQDMYQSYKQKNPQTQAKTSEKNPADAADKFKDPFADIDTALSGVFTSLGRGLGQTMKQIGDTISDGAKWAYDGVSGAVGRTVTALGNFAESTGNWFTEGHFASDTEVAQIREQERIQQEQESIKNGVKPVGMSEAEFKQKMKATVCGKEVNNIDVDGVHSKKEFYKSQQTDLDYEGKFNSDGKNTACTFSVWYMIANDFSDWIKDFSLTAQHSVYNKDVNDNGLFVKDAGGIIETATGKTDVEISPAYYVENNPNNPNSLDRSDAAQKMVDTLNEGGKIHARVSATNDGGHSVKIDGYQVDNGKLFFEVKDPWSPKYNMYDPDKRQLCFKDTSGIIHWDNKRSLIRFQTAKIKNK